MPKVSQLQIEKAAEACYSRLISSLGLKAAKKCNLIVGRKLRAEKQRRDVLDAESKSKANKRQKSKARRKSNKSKTGDGNKKGADELSQLTGDSSCGSGNSC